ncbi:MAG TPA: hypothetical protein VK741_30385 [Acetobacteraceae bacterium]|nr:hypothetical protein [Acetobacteraceae bacterium]
MPVCTAAVGSPDPNATSPDDQLSQPLFCTVRPPSIAKLPPIEPAPNNCVVPPPLCTPPVRLAPPNTRKLLEPVSSGPVAAAEDCRQDCRGGRCRDGTDGSTY